MPELQKILWKSYRMGFGGRGSGFDTEVVLSKKVSEVDKEAYERILTPREVEEKDWRPYPIYRYVPMLQTAFKVRHAYEKKVQMDLIAKKANQNLTDILALKQATYDLRQYG